MSFREVARPRVRIRRHAGSHWCARLSGFSPKESEFGPRHPGSVGPHLLRPSASGQAIVQQHGSRPPVEAACNSAVILRRMEAGATRVGRREETYRRIPSAGFTFW